MGILVNQYGSFFILVVMAKLPADVHLQIAQVTTSDIWETDKLLQVLRTKVEAREISEGVKVYEIHSSTTLSYQHRSTQNISISMVTQDIGNSSVACVYCRENHYSASCQRSLLYQHAKKL